MKGNLILMYRTTARVTVAREDPPSPSIMRNVWADFSLPCFCLSWWRHSRSENSRLSLGPVILEELNLIQGKYSSVYYFRRVKRFMFLSLNM